MYIAEEKQMQFHEGWFIPPEVDTEHEIIKLSHAIDWDRLTGAISRFSQIYAVRDFKLNCS